MKLLTFEIPDDLALVPEWLEGHLMGLDLHQVAAELGVLAAAGDVPTVSLDEVLGEQRREVLHSGLRSLTQSQLRHFLTQPQLLLELQRLVLDEGGEYWTTVPPSDAVRENSKSTWESVQAALERDRPKAELAKPLLDARHPWFWAGASWVAAGAAVVFLLFVQGDRVDQLEKQLIEQTAKADTLRQELEHQRALAATRVEPADLPGAAESLVLATPDPIDLPDDNPSDLPDSY